MEILRGENFSDGDVQQIKQKQKKLFPKKSSGEWSEVDYMINGKR